MKKVAQNAALEGGKILRNYFGKTKRLNITEKTNAGIVTEADLRAEEKIIKILSKYSQQFGFLAEETGEAKIERSGRWVIDPLDGTSNFAHGFPIFCVSIAAEWEGEVQVGVIYHPLFDELYCAVKGRGATLNGRKIKISRTRSLPKALVTTGFAYQMPRQMAKEIRVFETITAKARGVRRPGSAAMDLAYTASGVFDGFWEMGLQPWDVAAGALIVKEAGGKVTGYDGSRFHIESKSILASNSWLHSELLKELKSFS